MWEDVPLRRCQRGARASKVFPGVNPLGRRIRTDKTAPWLEILSVSSAMFGRKGWTRHHTPKSYEPFSVMPMPFLTIVVRHASKRSRVDAADGSRRRPASRFGPRRREFVASRELSRRAYLRPALRADSSGDVCSPGCGARRHRPLTGVMSYSVAQRHREIAIRLALGAVPAGVRSMVVGATPQDGAFRDGCRSRRGGRRRPLDRRSAVRRARSRPPDVHGGARRSGVRCGDRELDPSPAGVAGGRHGVTSRRITTTESRLRTSRRQ